MSKTVYFYSLAKQFKTLREIIKMRNNCSRKEQRPETYEKSLSTENVDTKGELVKQQQNKKCNRSIQIKFCLSFKTDHFKITTMEIR